MIRKIQTVHLYTPSTWGPLEEIFYSLLHAYQPHGTHRMKRDTALNLSTWDLQHGGNKIILSIPQRDKWDPLNRKLNQSSICGAHKRSSEFTIFRKTHYIANTLLVEWCGHIVSSSVQELIPGFSRESVTSITSPT